MTPLVLLTIISLGFALALGLAPAVFVIICTTILTIKVCLGFVMDRNQQRYLRGVIGLAFVALIVLDVVLAVFFGQEGTISQVLLKWAQEQPFIPFAFGFIMGHIFWKNDGGKP